MCVVCCMCVHTYNTHIHRVGQSHKCTPYVIVYVVISLPKQYIYGSTLHKHTRRHTPYTHTCAYTHITYITVCAHKNTHMHAHTHAHTRTHTLTYKQTHTDAQSHTDAQGDDAHLWRLRPTPSVHCPCRTQPSACASRS